MGKRRTFIKQAITLGALHPLSKNISGINEEQKKLHVVCVGAHPDDPESGCGGTLALYANAGHRVSIVYLTRGEAGITGKSHEEAARIRTAESEAACKILGAQPYFFGQVDGSTHFDGGEIARMQQLLATLKPDILFTHWSVDSHPDHQVAALLCYQSWLRSSRSVPVYFFEVNGGFQTMQFQPTTYVDITAIAAQKKNALYQHKSQDPDDIYFNHHFIMQQFRGRELGVKEAEAFVRLDAFKGDMGF
jgi:LmbE family N-acetylglucosaminyl deacetylase